MGLNGPNPDPNSPGNDWDPPTWVKAVVIASVCVQLVWITYLVWIDLRH